MKNKTTLILLAISISLLSFSCSKNEKKDSSQVAIQTNKEPESKSYPIKGEEIYLREGPGKKFKKLVNVKATEALGETNYMQVDYTCTVKILEEKDGWAQIVVVDPPHLTASYTGWIPLKNIEKGDESSAKVDLSKLKYETILTTENNVSKNYHILLDISDLTKEDIKSFVYQFREKNCSSCTINIYDSKTIKDLIEKYPLKGAEYIKFADHFVASSTFDAPKLVSFYPFQDIQYKEYGGKNLKEDKMK